MLRKTLFVAWREFSSTVFTKGFLLGVLMMPVIAAIAIGGAALTDRLKGPRVSGSIAVIDRAGGVAPGISARFSKDALKAEKDKAAEAMAAEAKRQAEKFGLPPEQVQAAPAIAAKVVDNAMADADISIDVLAPDADAEIEKIPLATADARQNSDTPVDVRPRLALAVIPPGAIAKGADGEYATFDLFTAPKLDFQIKLRIERKISEAVIDARVQNDPALRASGHTAESIRELMKRPEARVASITATGEKKDLGVGQIFLPMAFMGLLLMSVMTGGQLLLTSTVEEKSSRVMEVLLSAVSPVQLMLGKIVGQMTVSLLMLAMYSGVGVAGLVAFSFMHILDPKLLIYMFIFFFISFFTIASLLAAVGSAVSEMREAQTLQTPIIFLIMIPWLLVLPISRAPNAAYSVALSFVPIINPFVMMIRLTGSEPPPFWQIPVAIAIGLATVVFSVWAAAKVFRIGVLMYGKPPNIRTLIKWVRMA